MGANPDGPTELLAPNSSFPMTTKPPKTEKAVEDIVYLNIKENMNKGKSQTWLKYGSMIAEEYGFDYITKVDSDTLVFIPQFLDYVDKTLKPSPYNQRVFGGLRYCLEKCPFKLVGQHYFSGEFYYMSPDLASYITSDKVDRTTMSTSYEDVDIGNFVFTHPLPIQSVAVEQRNVLRTPKHDAHWFWVNPENAFGDKYWAHTTVDGGAWFKTRSNFMETWRNFQYYWNYNCVRRGLEILHFSFAALRMYPHEFASFLFMNNVVSRGSIFFV
jgi:hypothetical protein